MKSTDELKKKIILKKQPEEAWSLSGRQKRKMVREAKGKPNQSAI